MVERNQGTRGRRERRRENAAATAPAPPAPRGAVPPTNMMQFNPVGATLSVTPEQAQGLVTRFGGPEFGAAMERAVSAAADVAPQAPAARPTSAPAAEPPARPSASVPDRAPTQMTGQATTPRGTAPRATGGGSETPLNLTGYQAKAFGPLLSAGMRTAGSVTASQATPDAQEQYRSTVLQALLAALDQSLASNQEAVSAGAMTPEESQGLFNRYMETAQQEYDRLYGTSPDAAEALLRQGMGR